MSWLWLIPFPAMTQSGARFARLAGHPLFAGCDRCDIAYRLLARPAKPY
jgi:hypothetical protein